MTRFQHTTANDLVGNQSPKKLALALNSFGFGLFFPMNTANVTLGVIGAPLLEHKVRILVRTSRAFQEGELLGGVYYGVHATGEYFSLYTGLMTHINARAPGEYVLNDALDAKGIVPGDVVQGYLTYIEPPSKDNLVLGIVLQFY